MPETRREVLSKILAGPLAAVGVHKAVEIPTDTKVLILDFLPDAELDYETTKKAVQTAMENAGMGHVQVLLSVGLNGVAVVK